MPDKIESLVSAAYKRWKKRFSESAGIHPDQEDMACFLEGCASLEESERIIAHLIVCDDCARILALSLDSGIEDAGELPEPLLSKIKDVLSLREKSVFLEISLRVKERVLEIVNSTGDILLGQELVPAPVLRSRDIKDFKDEVIILKDFNDIRLEVKVENKGGRYFNVTIRARQKNSARPFKDMRVTLIKEGMELESYFSDSGSVSFEHILLGKYNLEVTSIKDRLALVVLDIKA